jgi:hypothetical protein
MKKKPRSKAKVKTAKKGKTKKTLKAKAKVKKAAPKRPKAKSSVIKKKPAKAKAEGVESSIPRPAVMAPPNSVLLGFVEDYFAKIGVIALTLQAPVAVGQKIHVLGHTTNLPLIVDSMQIDHASVTQAGPKDGVGIKVIGRARRGDHVYLLK